MHYHQAGIHKLEDGTHIYVCNCASCLLKNVGKPKQVHQNTYFKHRSSRLADLPHPYPPSIPQPATPATARPSSKQRLDAPNDNDPTRKRCHVQPSTDTLICDPTESDSVIDHEEDLDNKAQVEHVAGHDALEAIDYGTGYDLDTTYNAADDADLDAPNVFENREVPDGDIMAPIKEALIGPGDSEEVDHELEEENCKGVDLDLPPNHDQNQADIAPAQTMGWTDKDLEELHRMARLADTQDAMAFINALRQASLDNIHS
ncbi:hypothetical protein DFH29DRAFT_878236 [Suillus ampliporus]|nr:hypothetical protein DFH29DRAFT_878236 [Suillus ampliporus]